MTARKIKRTHILASVEVNGGYMHGYVFFDDGEVNYHTLKISNEICAAAEEMAKENHEVFLPLVLVSVLRGGENTVEKALRSMSTGAARALDTAINFHRSIFYTPIKSQECRDIMALH